MIVPILISTFVVILCVVLWWVRSRDNSLTPSEEKSFEELVASLDSYDDTPWNNKEEFNPISRNQCITSIALVIKAKKGLLERSSANRLMVQRLVFDQMVSRGLRPTHIARLQPLCIALVFVPLATDVAAKKMEAFFAVTRREALITTNWWSLWTKHRAAHWRK